MQMERCVYLVHYGSTVRRTCKKWIPGLKYELIRHGVSYRNVIPLEESPPIMPVAAVQRKHKLSLPSATGGSSHHQ